MVGLVWCPKQRGAMLLSGLLSAPFGFFELAFVPEYWNPVLVGRWGAAPEDVIFSFANGVIVWFLATCLFRPRIGLSLESRGLLKRYLGCLTIGVAFSLLFWLAGLRIMTAALLTMAIGLLIGVKIKPELWPIAISGAVGFTILYGVVLGTTCMLWPHFLQQWNTDNLCGLRVLGLPLEEIVWAWAFGTFWPRFMAYVFNARLVRPGPP
jgi:hypothetical protein